MSSSPAAAGPVEQPASSESMPAAFGVLRADQLPAWLPPVLATLYAGYADGDSGNSDASRWAHRLAGLVAERGAALVVLHDWQARTVVPMMAESAAAAGLTAPAALALQQLHARAAAGERFGEAGWRAVLEPALRELYRHAYGYAEAYTSAHASASAYAQANDFTEQGAVSFAESYAAMSAGANRDSFAEANAVANAAVLAAAYATGDPQAYAEAYPFALVQACAHAWANTAEPEGQPGDPARRRQPAYARLAKGLADSCAAALG
ncbi:SpcZ [Jatrophihabitans sp.]|uniref:SpcZ n=1 Tax=Jatrophihabitans sp. TaxID=1932789 RepID=UPI002C3CC51C|nr:hypothetical protein [Jatrophihabitans sp.]